MMILIDAGGAPPGAAGWPGAQAGPGVPMPVYKLTKLIGKIMPGTLDRDRLSATATAAAAFSA